MNIWKILRTEPTKDKKDIRRAYAAQSKKVHPEEDSEGFSELQVAYRQALDFANGSNQDQKIASHSSVHRSKVEVRNEEKERAKIFSKHIVASVREPEISTDQDEASECDGQAAAEEIRERNKAQEYMQRKEWERHRNNRKMRSNVLKLFRMLLDNRNKREDPVQWAALIEMGEFKQILLDEKFSDELLALLLPMPKYGHFIAERLEEIYLEALDEQVPSEKQHRFLAQLRFWIQFKKEQEDLKNDPLHDKIIACLREFYCLLRSPASAQAEAWRSYFGCDLFKSVQWKMEVMQKIAIYLMSSENTNPVLLNELHKAYQLYEEQPYQQQCDIDEYKNLLCFMRMFALNHYGKESDQL